MAAKKKAAKKKAARKKSKKKAAKKKPLRKPAKRKPVKKARKAKKAKKAKKRARKLSKIEKTVARASEKLGAEAPGGKAAGEVTRSAIEAYRDKTDKRLDAFIKESMALGDELFGAIDAARTRYLDEWERMRRQQLGVRMRLWKVRPSQAEGFADLKQGIDEDLKQLEGSWKSISREVKTAIKTLK